MSYLIRSNSLDFITIQETKLNEVSTSLVHSLWGNFFCDLSFSSLVSSSSNLPSIMCSSKDRLLFFFSCLGFFTCLEWALSNYLCFVINVYFKCSLTDKRVMCADLISRKASF